MGFKHEPFILWKLPRYFFIRVCGLMAYLSILSYWTVLLHRLRGTKIGKEVFIGHYVAIDNMRPDLVELGDKVGITSGSFIITHRFDMTKYTPGMAIMDIPYEFAKVKIEEGAFVGLHCVILPGVTIGKGAIIGANSVVTNDIPPYSVAVGSPAKVKSYLFPQKEIPSNAEPCSAKES